MYSQHPMMTELMLVFVGPICKHLNKFVEEFHYNELIMPLLMELTFIGLAFKYGFETFVVDVVLWCAPPMA